MGGGGGRGPARTQVGGCRQERAPLRRRGVQRRAGCMVPAPSPGAACERRESVVSGEPRERRSRRRACFWRSRFGTSQHPEEGPAARDHLPAERGRDISSPPSAAQPVLGSSPPGTRWRRQPEVVVSLYRKGEPADAPLPLLGQASPAGSSGAFGEGGGRGGEPCTVGALLAGIGAPELRDGCAGSAGSVDSLAGWEQKEQHGEHRHIRGDTKPGSTSEGKPSRLGRSGGTGLTGEDREPPAGACEPGSLCLRVRGSRQAHTREPLDKAIPSFPRAEAPTAGSVTGRRCACHRRGCGRGADERRWEQPCQRCPGATPCEREALGALSREALPPREFGGDGRLARQWQLAAAGRPPAETRSAGAAFRRGASIPAVGSAVPGAGRQGRRLWKRGRASGGGGQGDSPGLGGTGLGPPLPPPGGGAVRLFWLPAASRGRGDTAPAAGEKRRSCAGADRGCRRKTVLLGKQHPPLPPPPPCSPARAVCSPLIARRGHPAPAAPPSRDGYIQRLLSRNFPGTASCDRTRSGASAAIAASRGRRTEPPPLSRRGSGRRTLPRGPPASSSSARGDAQVSARGRGGSGPAGPCGPPRGALREPGERGSAAARPGAGGARGARPARRQQPPAPERGGGARPQGRERVRGRCQELSARDLRRPKLLGHPTLVSTPLYPPGLNTSLLQTAVARRCARRFPPPPPDF
ncbi:collagen, type I, alpha 1b-like [Sylvia atricapilla]|uniref:collagen, type I, alpha 1b-like n=1 Tax=Sylvia atricapilla TaxID=48155 RepID=UPI003399CCAA